MGGRSVWTLPVLFPLIITMGGIAGMGGVVLPQ
jgi:urease accessory protein